MKFHKERLSILFIVLAFFILLLNTDTFGLDYADVVYLKDGSKIVGVIIEQIPNQSVKIQTRDGSEYTYTFDKIEKIRKEPLRDDFFRLKPKSLTGESYTEVGVTFSHPLSLNGVAGYWLGPIGIRMTGMYLGSTDAGVQLNLGYKFIDNEKNRHSWGILLGWMYDAGYAGIAYHLNYRSFFAELGWAGIIGRHFRSSQGYLLQIGYMHRFIPK